MSEKPDSDGLVMLHEHELRDRLRSAQAENAELRKVLSGYLDAARSWHEMHHPTGTIQCDWFCDLIPQAEAALCTKGDGG